MTGHATDPTAGWELPDRPWWNANPHCPECGRNRSFCACDAATVPAIVPTRINPAADAEALRAGAAEHRLAAEQYRQEAARLEEQGRDGGYWRLLERLAVRVAGDAERSAAMAEARAADERDGPPF